MKREIIIFGLRGGGALITFISGVLITRTLGIQYSGYFALSLSIITVFSVIANLGYGTYILKVASSHVGDLQYVSNVFFRLQRNVIYFSIILIFLIIFSAKSISKYIEKEEIEVILYIMSGCVFLSSSSNIHNSLMHGRSKYFTTVFMQNVFIPLSITVLLLSVLALKINISHIEMAFIYLLVSVVTFALGLNLSYRGIPKRNRKVKLIIHANDFWVINLMTIVLAQGALFVSSKFISIEDYALISSALKIANLITFIYTSILVIYTPQFSFLFHSKEFDRLKRLSKKATREVAFFGLGFVFIMIVNSNLIMSVYGPEFTQGAKFLMVLLIGQALNLITFISTNILTMCGFEKIIKKSFMFSTILSLFIAIVLSFYFGSVGTVVAITMAISLQNIIAFFIHKNKLGYYSL